MWAFKTDAEVIEAVEPFVIHVLARSWTENDLAGKIEAAAVRAGLEKLYLEHTLHTCDSPMQDDDEEAKGDMKGT